MLVLQHGCFSDVVSYLVVAARLPRMHSSTVCRWSEKWNGDFDAAARLGISILRLQYAYVRTIHTLHVLEKPSKLGAYRLIREVADARPLKI